MHARACHHFLMISLQLLWWNVCLPNSFTRRFHSFVFNTFIWAFEIAQVGKTYRSTSLLHIAPPHRRQLVALLRLLKKRKRRHLSVLFFFENKNVFMFIYCIMKQLCHCPAFPSIAFQSTRDFVSVMCDLPFSPCVVNYHVQKCCMSGHS